MCQLNLMKITALLVAYLLCTVWQTSSEAQPWKHLQPGIVPQPDGAARDKMKLKIPPEPQSYPSDPLQSDRDIVLLKAKLGEDYSQDRIALNKDEFLMKKNNATKAHEKENEFVRKMLTKSMPEEIKTLDFKMPGIKRYLGPKASKKLQLWLWQVSHCSVVPKWKDLGARYWPRYVNVGKCSKKATCSFPSGMKCRIAKTKNIGVLRWHCLDRLVPRKAATCIWLKFNYPVLAECKCKCLH